MNMVLYIYKKENFIFSPVKMENKISEDIWWFNPEKSPENWDYAIGTQSAYHATLHEAIDDEISIDKEDIIFIRDDFFRRKVLYRVQDSHTLMKLRLILSDLGEFKEL